MAKVSRAIYRRNREYLQKGKDGGWSIIVALLDDPFSSNLFLLQIFNQVFELRMPKGLNLDELIDRTNL